MVYGILMALLVICSVLLVGVILLQRGKGGGLAGAFGMGGGETAFGTRAATLAQKVTVVLGILLLVLTLLVSIVRARSQQHGPAAAPTHQHAPAPMEHNPLDDL